MNDNDKNEGKISLEKKELHTDNSAFAVKSDHNLNNSAQNYALWLQNISWGKFFLFVLFVFIGESLVQDLLAIEDGDFLDNLASLFLFISFGIKLFCKQNRVLKTVSVN